MSILAFFAIAAASPATACDILDYSQFQETATTAWDFRSPRLTVIGAEHVRDPAHPQFARIAQTFEETAPGLVFFEGPDRGIGEDRDTTIRTRGESGYVRFLASQRSLEARTLEPTPPEQVKMLLDQFDGDKVLLFFILRETSRLREREALSGESLDRAIAGLLAKVAPIARSLGAPAIPDVAALDDAARRYWPDRDWREAPSDWFSPLADDAETGGLFMGAINRADSANRNRHMAALFTAAVRDGKRPFVVVGRNHVPMIAPALACAVGGG